MPDITLIQRPHIFCFSKNVVQYKFTVADYTAPGAIIWVQLYMRPVGDVTNGTLIYADSIKPSAIETAINLQDVIDANLEHQLPDFAGATIQSNFKHINEFYTRYAYTTDADTALVWSTEITKIRYAVKGGIAKPDWDWNNYFIYQRTSKRFLTWLPNSTFVGLNDAFFISFLNTVGSVALALNIDAEYSDGSTSNISVVFGDSGELRLYHLAAGVNQLGIDTSVGQLYRYTLKVVENGDTTNILAGPLTFYIDYRKFYYTKFLHYYNSLGGLQYTRVRGDIEYEVPRNFSESERYQGISVIGSPPSEEYNQSGISKTDTFKGETAWINTRTEYDVLQELLLTLFAWERKFYIPAGVGSDAGRNLRIYITQKSAKMGSTADKRQSLALEWRYSFTNQVYTPFVALGNGVDEEDYTPICTPVEITGTPELPDAVSGLAYSYSIPITGSAVFSLSAITKPAWMAIDISGNNIVFSGTPAEADEATGIAVAFTVSNACGSVDFAETTIDVTGPPDISNTAFVFIASGGDGYYTTGEDATAALGSGTPASATVYLNPSAVNSGTGDIISGSAVYTDAANTVLYNDAAHPTFSGWRIMQNIATSNYYVVRYVTFLGEASITP